MHKISKVQDLLENPLKHMEVPSFTQIDIQQPEMLKTNPVISYLEERIDLRRQLINEPNLNKRLEIFNKLLQ